MSNDVKYRRVLLKISGEGLMGDREFGLCNETIDRIANEVRAVRDTGTQVCAVVGGGNIYRGVSGAAGGMERASADHMGMLATVINAGTGNPFFTTDTAAALRAVEMGCDALLKATQVDGVYSADPHKVKDAQRYDSLTYMDVLSRDLKVMDASAIALCRENHLPILVFSLHQQGAFAEVVSGRGRFTIIKEGD